MGILNRFSFNANLGGMAGGKGLIGIYVVSKLKYAKVPFKVLRPNNSIRENEKPALSSRASKLFFDAEVFDTKDATSIYPLLEPHIEYYIFEEAHMVEDTANFLGVLEELIDARVSMNILALTNDTGARIFPIAAYCLSRGATIRKHFGVCQHSDLCRSKAVYSQLIDGEGNVIEDAGPIIATGDVDGSKEEKLQGKVDYQPRCRGHFEFDIPRAKSYSGGIFIPDPIRLPREELPFWLVQRQSLVREKLEKRVNNNFQNNSPFLADYPSSHLITELRQRAEQRVKTYFRRRSK